MINEERLLNEFIELVSVPCPSLDEKAEADLIVKKLAELGIKAEIDDAGKKSRSHHRQRMGIYSFKFRLQSARPDV